MAQGERAELRQEVVAHLGCMSQQILIFNRVDDSDGYGAGQRASAESGAVHPRVDGARSLFGAEYRADGNAACKRFGQSGDVGLNAVMLVGTPFAGTAHATLNLIGDQQSSGRAGQRTCLDKKLLREWTHAALALNGFDQNGADFAGELGAQVSDIVEANKLYAGNDGAEGLTILRLVGGGNGTEGTSVEALLEGEEFGADLLTFFAQDARVMVLDDATSSLDMVTEALVSQALTDQLRDRTRVVVAHRAGTAARADLVAWIDGGRVQGLAAHDELWSDPGYRAVFAEEEVV